MNWIFPNKKALADYLEEKARGIRARRAGATASSVRTMNAEAHAYEQSAMMIRQAIFTEETK